MQLIPDRTWYESVSQDRGVSFRCPFATVEACPRYYQSLALLGEAGSTSIPESEDKRLLKKWRTSDLWPRTDEQATSISGPVGTPSTFSNFCPEVSFERFGYFATLLARYRDEIDSGVAQEILAQEGIVANHPSWSWASCVGQHFTECPIYAVLSYRSHPVPAEPKEMQEPWWQKHLFEIVGTILAALAVALLTKCLG